MKLIDAQNLTILRRARIVAGERGLHREVHWVHIVDMPDVLHWVRPGQLLLTTGYSWSRDPDQQRALIRALAEKDLAGVGLAVPRFFDHFPETFRDEAEKLDLPLLEIPWEIPFALITEELHTLILSEQTRLIEQSERIHRSLTRAALEANSLQDIAETLGELIHRAVTIEDPEGSVLGYYRIAEMEDKVRRASLQEGHSPPDFLNYLRESGSQQLIDQTTAPIRIPPVAAMGFTGRIVCPIWLKDEIVGRVWIIEGDTPLSDLDLRAAEHTATVAALQIAHQQALASLEVRVGYSFLSALLEGRFEPTPQSLERARLQGFSLEASYRVGLLGMNEAVPLSHEGVLRRDRLVERLRQRLQQLGIPPLISVSLNQIPFLLPAQHSGDQVWLALSAQGIAFALSRPYPGIAGVRQAYVEAQGIAPHVQFGDFCRYENVLLPRVLAGDGDAREAFLKGMFDPLVQARRGEILISTLVAYVEADFRLKRAASALHIHPKSLRYRLERIGNLLNVKFDSPDMRFQLQLAVRLLSMNNH
jgi:purine catabolism regulator